MPVLFWNDSDGQKYKKAYFSMFPGKFWHINFIKFFQSYLINFHQS